ncbi:MAG TPA: TIGR03790 family protein [Vicinamibacterales bacterium]|nr:TIGR03790 family protein [Vicinamibacterales bacterium]
MHPAAADAQSAENVLLVINEQSPDSIRVGEHYARARALPAANVVRIKAPASEGISRSDYESTIESPIGQWVSKHLLQDQILFIVLAKGVPLRVDGTDGQSGTTASVDSELTLLYRKMTGRAVLAPGRVENPYYLGDRLLSAARRFSRIDSDLYLVTRIDAFTAEEAIKLIDRGLRPSRGGAIVLDQKATSIDRGGDAWLADAAKRLTDADAKVTFETTKALAAADGPVLGYFSWGSNDPSNQLRTLGFNFAPGAIGGMYVSTDGRTFREPPAAWRPAPAGATTGGQSLAADFIREGITGIAANVSEPYLDGIVRPQILFPAYLAGFTLAESYYLAMPYLSWQTTVIGDPLCAPFLTAALPAGQIHRGVNRETELPALFSERRLAAIRAGDLKVEGIKLHLKAMSMRAQGRTAADVEATLTRATEIEPRLVAAHLLLADSMSSRNDHDGAAARYRAILVHDAGNLVALNNLAYLLADKKGAAAEALPLAEKAYRLSNQAPMIADTLGWVQFKLDHADTAIVLIERAAAMLPTDIDVLVHAATVNLALGKAARAKLFLDAALKADPKAQARADVQTIMAKIKG